MSTHEVIVVEYPAASDKTPEAAAELLKHLRRCLAVREVTFVRSYTSFDGQKLTRIFTAPDAGAVRYAHASAGFTSVMIWAANETSAL